MRNLGFILIAAGLLALVIGEFTYTRRRETVELGPLKATVQQKECVTIPRAIGVIAVVAGVAVLLVGKQRKS